MCMASCLFLKRWIWTFWQVFVVCSKNIQKSRVWSTTDSRTISHRTLTKNTYFFINIYLEIFRFFFIQLSKNPQGLPATYSDLDTIACVKNSLKKLTTKEKLWHASQNGCMVCRDHKLTNGTRGYIAKSLRESPQREFLYKLILRLSIPWCYITQQKDNTPAVMCIENGSFFSSLC